MTNVPWKAILVGVAIAVGGNLVGWLWGNFRETITAGKADTQAVEKLEEKLTAVEQTNAAEHTDIKVRQKRDGRVLRAVAKKLKVDLPPEPAE